MNINRKHFWVTVPTVIALAFTLSACGQTTTVAPTTPTPTVTSEPSTPSPTETPTEVPATELEGDFITKTEDGKFILPTGVEVVCPDTSKGIFVKENGDWSCDTSGEW